MIPKFKAWDKIDKVIREVTAIDWSLDLVEFMHGANERSFENVILLQSTGLKDKSSVEIYEGDIVSVRNHPFQKTELSGVGIEIDGDYLIGWSDHNLTWLGGDLLLYQLKPYIEVIGNIYDNPELLEVE